MANCNLLFCQFQISSKYTNDLRLFYFIFYHVHYESLCKLIYKLIYRSKWPIAHLGVNMSSLFFILCPYVVSLQHIGMDVLLKVKDVSCIQALKIHNYAMAYGYLETKIPWTQLDYSTCSPRLFSFSFSFSF